MRSINKIEGRAYPFGRANVDTDIIVPARWLKTITRKGLGAGAFEAIRSEPDNVFDDPRYAGAPILIAGENYGCGSSREHAAWAMADLGIRAVIAPSFSDIFAGNAFKNAILTIILLPANVEHLIEVARTHPITIDLPAQIVTTPLGEHFRFELDAFRKYCLVNGLDEIGITLQMEASITGHEAEIKHKAPWIDLTTRTR